MSIEDDIFDVTEKLEGTPIGNSFNNILKWAYDLEGENERLRMIANPLIDIINLIKGEVSCV